MLVDPQNTADIAEAIYQVCHDAALRQTLSARGLARAKRYNWDDCATQTLAILQEAADHAE
ncbi:MAG: hypothetical protein R6X32_16765 [Chloroflexota bacterium]